MKSYPNYKNDRGKPVIQALFEAAKKSSGFVDFCGVKPGTKEQVPKPGYVGPIPGTDYYTGTGVYLQHIRRARQRPGGWEHCFLLVYLGHVAKITIERKLFKGGDHGQ